MKDYYIPEVEIVNLNSNDVIATSIELPEIPIGQSSGYSW